MEVASYLQETGFVTKTLDFKQKHINVKFLQIREIPRDQRSLCLMCKLKCFAFGLSLIDLKAISSKSRLLRNLDFNGKAFGFWDLERDLLV